MTDKRGFTLAETLAAMLFMAIVIPVAVRGVMLANRAGVVAERKRVAAELADRLLVETIVTQQWMDGSLWVPFATIPSRLLRCHS